MSDIPKATHLYGIHDPGAEHLMTDAGIQGWVVFSHALANAAGRCEYATRATGNVRPGCDYTEVAPHVPIARLNWGYYPQGTIPEEDRWSDMAVKCWDWVQTSEGCHHWILANEANHPQEWPNGRPITASQYARCYALCRRFIRAATGHGHDQVLVAAIAPWNDACGDWVRYFAEVLSLVGNECDGFALHTYTHGHDPNLIYSEATMGPPYQDRHYNFMAYRDFLAVVPQHLRHLPVYITETDPDMPWKDENNGWVQNAYGDINWWNEQEGTQKIQALCLYRWDNYDQWAFCNKQGIQADFREAMRRGYLSPGCAT